MSIAAIAALLHLQRSHRNREFLDHERRKWNARESKSHIPMPTYADRDFDAPRRYRNVGS